MKKIISICLVCLATVGLLAGCGNQTETTPNTTDQTQTEQNGNIVDETKDAVEDTTQKTTAKIKDIANQTKADLEKTFGTAMETDKGSYFYEDQGVQIQYMDDKAAKIIILPQEKIAADDADAMLNAIGIKSGKTEPTQTEDGYVWNDVDGLYKVTVHTQNGNVDYYEIITDEQYDK